MRGIDHSQPTSPAWAAGCPDWAPTIDSPISLLTLLVALLLALAAWRPAAAQAVSFTGPTSFGAGSSPLSLATGDFNGDLDPDLAVANEVSNNVSIFLGSAGGGFTGPTNFGAGSGPGSVAAGDFNGDQDLDLAVANEFSNNVSVLLGGAGGSFTASGSFAVGSGPLAVAVGHFDSDLDPDLAVANEGSNNVSILLGSSGSNFTGPTNFGASVGPLSIAIGHFNGDSDSDLAVANDLSNNVSILLGGAGGSFTGPTNFGAGSAPGEVATGDFNGDSDPDLAVANELSNNISILLGAAGGSFTGPTNVSSGGSLPSSVAAADFNGDADPDLAVANAGSDKVSILSGGTGSTFTSPADFGAGDGPTAIAVDDFNGDSDPDLATANEFSNNVTILLGANLPAPSSPPPPYDRPRRASPLRVALVPALRETISQAQCEARGGAFSAHGAPLSFDSCNPPAYRPGTAARLGPGSSSSASLGAVYGDTNAGNGDQANLRVVGGLNDVQAQTGGDYAPNAGGPDVTLVAAIRLSDTYNGPSQNDAATSIDLEFDVPIDCVTTPGSEGSTCAVDTTIDALTPGAIRENESSVLQVLRTRVEDSGLNGTRGDLDDMTFATQGLYMP